jgi:Fur family peroxide stress response transcriptional regulator
MKISNLTLDQRMKNFMDACRTSGAKLTHQRIEIFREVAQTPDHPDAETIYKRVSERIPTISQDTVYRTLWWLKEIGLIHTLGTPRNRTRFDANLGRHHHFICTQCGLIQDFESNMLDQINLPESIKSIGYAEITRVEIKGLCLKCAGS